MSTAEPPPSVCFLLGLPRSGTTLLAHLLQQHPDLLAPPEPWLMLALDAFGSADRDHPADANLIQMATTEFFDRIDRIAAYRSLTDAAYSQYLAASGKRCFVDKTPRYWMVTNLIDALYPEAPQIVLLRNPYAVAASLKSTWGIPLLLDDCQATHSTHLADLVLGQPALAARRSHPRTQVVHYEALVRQPVEEVKRLVAGMGFDSAGIISAETENTDYLRAGTFGDRKILKKSSIDTSSIQAWRDQLSLAEMQAVTDMIGADLIIDLGYANELHHAYGAGVIDGRHRTTQDYRQAFEEWQTIRRDRAQTLEEISSEGDDNPYMPHVIRWIGVTSKQGSLAADTMIEEIPPSVDSPTIDVSAGSIFDESEVQSLDKQGDSTDSADQSALPAEAPSISVMQGVPLDSEFRIFTSIPPRTDPDKQRETIATWRANGFTPVSVNHDAEVDEIKSLGLDIDVQTIPGRGKPLIGGILSAIRKTDSSFAALLNADCRMIYYPNLAQTLQRSLPGNVLYSQRLETVEGKPTFEEVSHGFDGFFFDTNLLDGVEDSTFRMGECWWDYWLPLRLAANGAQFGKIQQPVLLHEFHETNWSYENWCAYGEAFWQDLKKWAKQIALPANVVPLLPLPEMKEKSGLIATEIYQLLRDARGADIQSLMPAEYAAIENLLRTGIKITDPQEIAQTDLSNIPAVFTSPEAISFARKFLRNAPRAKHLLRRLVRRKYT